MERVIFPFLCYNYIMEKVDGFKIFEEVIKEAATGRISIDSISYYSLFETMIDGKFVTAKSSDLADIVSPILKINNLDTFKELLNGYLDIAYNFYGYNLMRDYHNLHDDYKELITLLWSNATLEDFLNPNLFLKKRIEFFENKIQETEKYIEKINAKLCVSIKQASVLTETPYYLNAELTDGIDSYILPRVYFGIFEDKAYIYAIQSKKTEKQSSFEKRMGRELYKVNDGFFEDVVNEENLKDITPSFILVANILVGLLKERGIKEIAVSSYLPIRYINKQLIQKRTDLPTDKVAKYSDEVIDGTQKNITDKFIRTFRRLDYHHSGMEIVSYPMELDSNMHIIMDDRDICNNELLNETFSLYHNRSR